MESKQKNNSSRGSIDYKSKTLNKEYKELKQQRKKLEIDALTIKIKNDAISHLSQKLNSKHIIERKIQEKSNYFKQKSLDFDKYVEEKKIGIRINKEIEIEAIKRRKEESEERIRVKRLNYQNSIKALANEFKEINKAFKEEGQEKVKIEYIENSRKIKQIREYKRENTANNANYRKMSKSKEELFHKNLLDKLELENRVKLTIDQFIKKNKNIATYSDGISLKSMGSKGKEKEIDIEKNNQYVNNNFEDFSNSGFYKKINSSSLNFDNNIDYSQSNNVDHKNCKFNKTFNSIKTGNFKISNRLVELSIPCHNVLAKLSTKRKSLK